jgi:anti-sigma factor RsiW
MRCSTVRTLLDDHVNGVLPSDRSSQVRAHLDICPECEQELELLRDITAPLSAWGDLEPPAGCFERIVERIDALPPEMHIPAAQPAPTSLRFLRGGARRLVTSGAVAAAVLVAAIALDRAGDSDGTRTAPERHARALPAMAGVPGVAGASRRLKPGEIALTRTRFAVTEDLEQRDGLRRRRSRDRRAAPSDLAVPVSADALGAGPR